MRARYHGRRGLRISVPLVAHPALVLGLAAAAPAEELSARGRALLDSLSSERMEGVFPHSREQIEKDFEGIPEEQTLKKIIGWSRLSSRPTASERSVSSGATAGWAS